VEGFCYEMTVFYDVAPCSLVEIDLRFRGAYCLGRTSEMTSSFYETTRLNIAEDTRRGENLKSHWILSLSHVIPTSYMFAV
jgi:hypothetical protein